MRTTNNVHWHDEPITVTTYYKIIINTNLPTLRSYVMIQTLGLSNYSSLEVMWCNAS
jgi:hypothetical protein